MKKVNRTTSKVEETINWDVQQWVAHNYCADIIVLTNGDHKTEVFTGTALPCSSYPGGDFSDGWDKDEFSILEVDVPFIISNKD